MVAPIEFGTVCHTMSRLHSQSVTVCILKSSEDLYLQMQFSLTILLCLRSDTCHYGHINRSYLLTYLIYIRWKSGPHTEMEAASVGVLLDFKISGCQ